MLTRFFIASATAVVMSLGVSPLSEFGNFSAEAQSINSDNRELLRPPSVQYPRRAAQRGIQGYCVVNFAISGNGTVENPTLVSCEPEGIFNRESERAARNLEYPPLIVDGAPKSTAGASYIFIFGDEAYGREVLANFDPGFRNDIETLDQQMEEFAGLSGTELSWEALLILASEVRQVGADEDRRTRYAAIFNESVEKIHSYDADTEKAKITNWPMTLQGAQAAKDYIRDLGEHSTQLYQLTTVLKGTGVDIADERYRSALLAAREKWVEIVTTPSVKQQILTKIASFDEPVQTWNDAENAVRAYARKYIPDNLLEEDKQFESAIDQSIQATQFRTISIADASSNSGKIGPTSEEIAQAMFDFATSQNREAQETFDFCWDGGFRSMGNRIQAQIAANECLAIMGTASTEAPVMKLTEVTKRGCQESSSDWYKCRVRFEFDIDWELFGAGGSSALFSLPSGLGNEETEHNFLFEAGEWVFYPNTN